MLDIDKLIKEAILENNPNKKEAYRAIKADLALIRNGVSDKDIVSAIRKNILIKEEDIKILNNCINDSDSNFESRSKMLKDYSEQLQYLKELLPPEIPEEKIQEYITTSYPNGYTIKEMGKIVKEVKQIYPTADGKVIARIVKEHII